MAVQTYCTGIQHIGIPTGNIEATKKFYESLGFECVHDAFIEEGSQNVSFLKMGDCVIETYESEIAGCDGAVDHLALNCTDVEAAYASLKDSGFKMLTDGVQRLPFWEKGIGFFIIEGPNKERIEFCQIF